MSLPFDELQTMIFNTLSGSVFDANQNAVPIYDHVPQDADYPYVVLGQYSAEYDSDKMVGETIECVESLTAFSIYSGTSEVNGILGQIYDFLTRYDLLSLGQGFDLIDVRPESTSVESKITSGDELIVREGMISFRFFVRERT